MLEMVALLRASKAAGASQLATVFAKWHPGAAQANNETAPGGGAEADEPVSLAAAKAAMLPPGVRDHDNDPIDYRQISIVPTPGELECQVRTPFTRKQAA